jgi:hypothetical protein
MDPQGAHETYFIELFSTVVKYGKIHAHVPLNELYIHVKNSSHTT